MPRPLVPIEKSSSRSSKSSVETDEQFVELATLGRAHGIRGAINLIIDSSMLEAVWPGLPIRLEHGSSVPKSYEIVAVNSPGKHVVVRLAGVNDRDHAESLTGAKVFIRREDLPVLGSDEYYDFELLGAIVETRAGEQLGTVTEILPTGANQVYVVSGSDGAEILVPAISGAVLEIKRAEKRIVVEPTALEYGNRDD
jgi:16S rRNA processing protein RimM